MLARPTLVEQETATVGQVFDSKTLIALPSNDGNVYSLHGAQFQRHGAGRRQCAGVPPGKRRIVLRLGNAPSSITFKIDGLTNTDPGFGTPTITPSLDSIQEFQILNNAYSAGMRGSARSTWRPRRAGSASAAPCTSSSRTTLQPANPVLGPQDPASLQPVRCNTRRASPGSPARFSSVHTRAGVTTR